MFNDARLFGECEKALAAVSGSSGTVAVKEKSASVSNGGSM